MTRLVSSLRIAFGLTLMALGVLIFGLICIPLLPSRRLRIAACNIFGHIMGPTMLWITGARVPKDVRKKLQAQFPAIYVSNHTSIIDMFIAIWVCPLFTCGVAKKEIIYYPFFGQLYWMSGHLRVDRTNARAAVAGMQKLGALVKEKGLGIWIWAEGTRSRDGRLLPLKKGFAHMALATGLPIVPVVVKGAHKGWKKNTLVIQGGCDVDVEVLAPIPTTDWTVDNLDEKIAIVHQAFQDALPEEQKGKPMRDKSASKASATRVQAQMEAATP